MAKKKSATPPPDRPEEKTPAPVSENDTEKQIDQSPKVRKAADAVRQAEARLQQARELYEKVRRKTVDRLRSARGKTVGELIDGTLEGVKKHPGFGVIAAALVGFFLGRMFRR